MVSLAKSGNELEDNCPGNCGSMKRSWGSYQHYVQGWHNDDLRLSYFLLLLEENIICRISQPYFCLSSFLEKLFSKQPPWSFSLVKPCCRIDSWTLLSMSDLSVVQEAVMDQPKQVNDSKVDRYNSEDYRVAFKAGKSWKAVTGSCSDSPGCCPSRPTMEGGRGGGGCGLLLSHPFKWHMWGCASSRALQIIRIQTMAHPSLNFDPGQSCWLFRASFSLLDLYWIQDLYSWHFKEAATWTSLVTPWLLIIHLSDLIESVQESQQNSFPIYGNALCGHLFNYP